MKINKKNTIIFFIVIVLISIGLYKYQTIFKSKNKSIDLININELSEEYMKDYFQKTEEIKKENNQENILIITSLDDLKDDYGAQMVAKGPNHQYFVQYETKEEKENALKKFKEESEVLVEENIIYKVTENEEVPSNSHKDEENQNHLSANKYNSWGIEDMGLDYLTNIISGKEEGVNNIVAAIIDTGLDVELFNQNYNNRLAGTYNVLDNDAAMVDEHGHGTHIAGTIAEGTPNNVLILPIKVSSDGYIDNASIIAAVNYITYNHKADVINMSFGIGIRSEAVYSAIEAARRENIISVAAAGNDGNNILQYPASLENTISVAAVNSSHEVASFSNHNSAVTFAAPGVDIASINKVSSGTSMATPHIVSAVAILKSANRAITLENTIKVLKKYTIDLGTPGKDDYYGYGYLNFKDMELCDCSTCTYCDGLCMFEDLSKKTATSITIDEGKVLNVNYGTISNILKTPITVRYSETDSEVFTLDELEGVKINNYNPTSEEQQTVTVTYNGATTSFTVTNVTNSGWTYTKIDDNTARIDSYIRSSEANSKKIYVPSTIDGYKIVAIGSSEASSNEGVFQNLENTVEEIYLPEEVTSIGDYAFQNLANVKKIDIPAATISVGESVFRGDKQLKEINAKITSLETKAFYECTNLSKIELGEGITSIPIEAFYGCSSLAQINIPSSVTTIKQYAFYFSGLTEVDLSKVEIVENSAFNGCFNLETVTFGDILTTLGDYSFASTNISRLNIPKNLINISEKAFLNTSGLEEITVANENPKYDSRNESHSLNITETNSLFLGSSTTEIPETITKIMPYAFSNNQKIEEMVIPENITEIPQGTFENCDNLTSILIPPTVNRIHSSAFSSDGKFAFIVLNNSYAKTFAQNNNFQFILIDPTSHEVEMATNKYEVFEKVDSSNFVIKLHYDDSTNRTETISDPTKYTITYEHAENGFRMGDTKFIVNTKNELGYEIEFEVSVTVSKATPNYVLPTNITGNVGQKLSEISLPEGFSWMNENETISRAGTVKYKARFTPQDTANYETVENIEITIVVDTVLGDITDNTTDIVDFYDGQEHTITLNISPSNYTAKYSVNNQNYDLNELPKFKDVGEYIVHYKVMFEDGRVYTSSKSIEILGISCVANSLLIKNNVLIVKDSNKKFDEIKERITVFADQKMIKHYSSNMQELDINDTKTGNIIRINVNITKNYDFYISLLGDVNCDGRVTSADYVKIRKHIMKLENIDKSQLFSAADVNFDDKINSADYVKIRKLIMNGEKLWQE